MELLFNLEFVFKLLLALILGGLVGFERENIHRPAGLRTHILVCVGSTLVMLTSEFIISRYHGIVNADPARLGAQVISGIGFLGAGTIIREGNSVKGLTTAASLWAVSCVGLAIGIGFYEGAIAATLLIYFTLMALKRMQKSFINKKRSKYFYIHVEYLPQKIEALKEIFNRYDISIKDIEFVNEDDKSATVKILIKTPHGIGKESFVDDVLSIEGVTKVYEC